LLLIGSTSEIVLAIVSASIGIAAFHYVFLILDPEFDFPTEILGVIRVGAFNNQYWGNCQVIPFKKITIPVVPDYFHFSRILLFYFLQ